MNRLPPLPTIFTAMLVAAATGAGAAPAADAGASAGPVAATALPVAGGTAPTIAPTAAATATLPMAASPDRPPSRADAVLQLLHDRGLVPSGSPDGDDGLLRRMRDRASDLVLGAVRFIGVPYRRGGSSEAQGFDCSGFTRHVFEHTVGLVLPRRADEQARQAGLLQVMRDELRPGDLVFFNTMRRAFSHVGIYVGDGRFVHAPRSGAEVRIEDMRQAYWSHRFDGARRAALTVDGFGDAATALPAARP